MYDLTTERVAAVRDAAVLRGDTDLVEACACAIEAPGILLRGDLDRIQLAAGRMHVRALALAYQGREATAADLAKASAVQVGTLGGPVWWTDCDCGGQDAAGNPLLGCGPGCHRGRWDGPLVWAAQDIGDTPGLWGLTEAEALAYLMPRWEAHGITIESQRAKGKRDSAERAAHTARASAGGW